VLAPASRRAKPAEERALLGAFVSDPALKSLLAGISRERQRGRVFYGADLPRPSIQTLSEDRAIAVVNDCQDSTGSGVFDLKTGRKLTKGVARNHVIATLHRQPDQVWRVVFISYPKSPC
jgi:hypothetical protein